MDVTRTSRTGVPAPVAVLVAVGTMIILVGGLIAWFDPAVLIPGSSVGHGVDLYGQRMAARNLALAVALGALLSLRAARDLAVVLAVAALVEIGDTISAIADADWAQASGLLIAVGFAWAAWRLVRLPYAFGGQQSPRMRPRAEP